MASLQMELDLQATVVLREQCGVCDPATFWLQTVHDNTPWRYLARCTVAK